MRYLYTLLFYFSLPIILLRLWRRARKTPAYASRISERFGYLPTSVAKNGIWVHSVSVGETLAAIPLIKTLKKQHPELPIIVTTTTPTGSARVLAALEGQVVHTYAPYDLPDALQRFLQQVQPRLLVLMETELWPNLLHTCAQRKIPVILANARLSARSAKGYQRINFLTRPMLQQITLIAAQYSADAERFVALGLDPARVKITGNLKFDLDIPKDLTAKASVLRNQWGAKRPVWIAASTHEGEDEIVLAAHAEIRKVLPQTLLIIVPRHPERFARVTALCRKQGYNTALRSAQEACNATTDIFIGDTMGELLSFYAAADVAFVGGSLIEQGGHNPLEPAALGIPVITGPHMFNFDVITQQLQSANALVEIHDTQQLATQVIDLLQNKSKRETMGNHGREVVATNRGALDRQLALINKLLI